MAPPEPGLAREIERIHRLEAANVIGWWEAADLIAGLEDGKQTTVHALAKLPLISLQARYLLLFYPHEVTMGSGASFRLPMTRDLAVAAILDRVS